MKALALALAVLCAPALAQDAVAHRGDDSVRITEAPCPTQVLKLLPEGTRGYFRAAFAIVDGKSFAGCWAARSDGMVVLMYPDGDMGVLPLSDFEQAPGA
jgi:hypothetical protein